MGETRVDLLHLLEDLRDAYPGAIEETILTEVIANSLDSGASVIRIDASAADAMVIVRDDGSGMKRRDLARYHDIAATTKTRGEGIGFAGVGIKLGLLIAERVITETRQKKTHVATEWRLSSKHRAPWKWIEPPGLTREHGTAVCLALSNALSPLLDSGFLEATVVRHFRPLLDAAFAEILAPYHSRGVRFEVNGRPLAASGLEGAERTRIEVRMPRKRKPSAAGYLLRSVAPLPESARGVSVSTLGKVIRTGWDWLGITPSDAERIGGLIEVPALAACLTLNKADFIHAGSHRATYLGYRKAIQEVVSAQLAAWGDARDPASDARRRIARPVERDLERVLVDLADEFPLLSALVEQRLGGQRRLPIARAGAAPDGRSALLASVVGTAERDSTAGEPAPDASVLAGATIPVDIAQTPTAEGQRVGEEQPHDARDAVRESTQSSGIHLPGSAGVRRPARYGLGIRVEARPDDPELSQLVESTVSVNEAHAAYRRAVASRSEGYHIALCVALALAPLTVEPPEERRFVNAFLTRWGEALDARAGKRRTARP